MTTSGPLESGPCAATATTGGQIKDVSAIRVCSPLLLGDDYTYLLLLFEPHPINMHQEALPLYLQIASQLRRNIQESVFKVGDRLPTETELSERFGVNRHTLRRAIEVLRQEGIVGVERGRGTFVMADPIAVPIGKRVRFNESLKAQSLHPVWQVLRMVELNADARLSKRLEIDVGAAVILFERLSSIEDIPISISSSYFPSQHFPGLIKHCETYRSVSKMLQKEYNCDHIRRSTRISARLAQANDARLLKMPANGPILLSESINVDQTGVVIEYGVTRFRGERMELVLENEA
ncbi:phosphonate metabolism transcriptional regulator PhnF [Nodosilinea sp. FACHB-13]|uniref:phosphonate metabolism transcriptional regulator PhnF n=1 Tax=Cyanophyceae TaxID=3028117 RepID=UPI001F550894